MGMMRRGEEPWIHVMLPFWMEQDAHIGEAVVLILHDVVEVVHLRIDDEEIALQHQGDLGDIEVGATHYLLHMVPGVLVLDQVSAEVPLRKRQHEAELKQLEEETAKRVEEAIRKNVEEKLNSEEVRLEIERRTVEALKKLFDDVSAQLEKEKEAALAEARQKEEQARREREELDRMLEENRRRVEESQRKEALELQRKEEERYRELELIQRQKEEAAWRKKLEEEEERVKQILDKSKSWPKLPFGVGL
ncbi:Arginine and glutamate-rich protein 1 [Dillenia turbinata]|uniref:Arginine and glutamate-rich protein 1 n=1 Tax=Dillenia turbinata TaxID=194707 RepID=A0AAN8Z7T1_9MAGN